MKQCRFGKHRTKRTWCYHQTVTDGAEYRSVINAQCESCPFFEEGDGVVVGRNQCLHRTAESVREVTCRTGCAEGKVLPIFGCAVHGECCQNPGTFERVKESLRIVGDRSQIKSCAGCSDRVQESKESV